MIWFQLFVFVFLWHLGTHMLLPAHCMGFSISFAKTSWFRYPSCSSSYGHSVIHFEWCVWVTWRKTINAAAVWYEARKHTFIIHFTYGCDYSLKVLESQIVGFILYISFLYEIVLFWVHIVNMLLLLLFYWHKVFDNNNLWGWTDLWKNWWMAIWQTVIPKWATTKESDVAPSWSPGKCGT